MTLLPSFVRHGPELPETPVVLSVPHAGRDYPMPLRAALRVPLASLRSLEDRHVDTLAIAARRHETLFVVQRARAWIDLNRAEHERDPQLDEGADPRGQPQSAKLRSGLGLVPRRAGAAGDIWRRRLSAEEVAARIRTDHRPYHQALHEALMAARERFGVAVLLDVHSMPSLGAAPTTPRIVLGDRFGKSAATRFVAGLEAAVRPFGTPLALNTPYSGGHVLDRHGNPLRGIHAIQIEIDRTLYLDGQLDGPGTGLGRTTRLLRAMIDAAADEALPAALAAE